MSPLPFELALALRYMRPKRTFVSIITLICIIGVMLGVAVLIIVIAVMTGFGEELRENLVGFSSHVRVERRGSSMPHWRETMERIEALPAVKSASPYINTQVLIETQPIGRPGRPFAPVVRGIDPKREGLASQLKSAIREGTFDLGPNSLLIGSEMALNLDLRVGDKMAVYSLPALKRMRETAGKPGRQEIANAQNFTIKGIFDAGLYDLNTTIVVTGLGDAQDLHGVDDEVSGISITLKDPDPKNTDAVAAQIQRLLGNDFGVATWLLENQKFLHALAVEKNMMFYLLFFIVLVAAFGIMSAMITFVVQKTREIGLLKALGASQLQIAAIFLMQGLIVGVIGVATGLAAGILLIHFRNDFLAFMNNTLHLDLFPPEIYQFRELPARIVISDVVIICSTSLVMCLFAGVVPALRAAWLQPVQALRNE
ncbi:MAG TPA: ABC transporter permease [Candidatus Limnocylindria bacterium]|jgi:lipoprotein-releasing system permease protein|nr:ABC transporter permease [Candidatus Limnocylindria bacterium]